VGFTPSPKTGGKGRERSGSSSTFGGRKDRTRKKNRRTKQQRTLKKASEQHFRSEAAREGTGRVSLHPKKKQKKASETEGAHGELLLPGDSESFEKNAALPKT